MNSGDESWQESAEEATDAITDLASPSAPPPALPTFDEAPPTAATGAASLQPLYEVLHDKDHFQVWTNELSSKRIECLWCTQDFPGNAKKMLYHVCGISNRGVKVCRGCIPRINKQRYLDLLERKENLKGKKAEVKFALLEEISLMQREIGAAVMVTSGLSAATPMQATVTTPKAASDLTFTTPRAASVHTGSNDSINGNKKRPSILDVDSLNEPFPSLKNHSSFKAHFVKEPKKMRQSKIWQTASDPAACLEMDVAVADFVLSQLWSITRIVRR